MLKELQKRRKEVSDRRMVPVVEIVRIRESGDVETAATKTYEAEIRAVLMTEVR